MFTLCVCVYVCVYICVCVYIYIYIYISAQTYYQHILQFKKSNKIATSIIKSSFIQSPYFHTTRRLCSSYTVLESAFFNWFKIFQALLKYN